LDYDSDLSALIERRYNENLKNPVNPVRPPVLIRSLPLTHRLPAAVWPSTRRHPCSPCSWVP